MDSILEDQYDICLISQIIEFMLGRLKKQDETSLLPNLCAPVCASMTWLLAIGSPFFVVPARLDVQITALHFLPSNGVTCVIITFAE